MFWDNESKGRFWVISVLLILICFLLAVGFVRSLNLSHE